MRKIRKSIEMMATREEELAFLREEFERKFAHFSIGQFSVGDVVEISDSVDLNAIKIDTSEGSRIGIVTRVHRKPNCYVVMFVNDSGDAQEFLVDGVALIAYDTKRTTPADHLTIRVEGPQGCGKTNIANWLHDIIAGRLPSTTFCPAELLRKAKVTIVDGVGPDQEILHFDPAES